MISRYFPLFLTLSIACAPFWVSAQQTTGLAEDAAVTYLERNWNRHGLASQVDVQDLVITDAVESRRSGATSVYLHQDIGDIPVIDGQMTISVDENGHVFHAAGQLIPDLSLRTVHSGAGVSAVNAVETILQEAGFPTPEPFSVTQPGVGPTNKTTLDDGGGFTYLPVTAEFVYIVDERENLRLAWDATVPLDGDDGAWRGLVDASSGEVLRLMDVLDRDNFGTAPSRPLSRKQEGTAAGMLPRPTTAVTADGGACYNVFAWPLMDPFHADPAWPDDGRTEVCDPADPVASPDGWHDDGVDTYTIVRGNNVYAFPDWDNCEDWPNPPNPEECDPVPETADGGSELQFGFPIDFDDDPHDYMEASVTNLFYWNNLVHDVLVHYGFDEAHGNFQQHNYTADGEPEDFVRANGQDGGGTNNANFLTPPDGENPRMQMYLGTRHDPQMDGSLDNHVVIHEYGHGISNRMTGGPSSVNCLQNNEHMGEGWSDWYGLMLTQEGTRNRDTPRAVGIFLFYDDRPNGIRPAPYSTDFAVNDYTYGDTPTQAIPHGVGFVWATILWEITWDLIDEYGYEQDIYNADAFTGNVIMMNVITEALNLQPCSPGFIDGRDAILEAVDVVYSDQTEEWREDLKHLMWEGFARRGLGFFATQGSSNSNYDNEEDFTVPSVIAPDPITDLSSDPDGDFVTLTWTAPNDDDSDVFNYNVRYASEPILDVEDWESATEVPAAESMVPQAPGEIEEFVVTDLEYETTYHFAIRSDDHVNLSDLSNSVEVTTLTRPVADLPLDPIEIELPVDGTHTHDVTIGNEGPSMLYYSIDLIETTEGLRNSEPLQPREPSGEQEALDNEEENASPAGEPQLLGEGGPDAFGYRWIDSNEPNGPAYEWIDITETGTALELDNNDYEIVELPFDFPYYQNFFDAVSIESNGALSFGDAGITFSNRPIPEEDDWNGIVAAYWDYLSPEDGGEIYYDMVDGKFVVSWIGIPHFDPFGEGGSFAFQVILDPGGGIVYQYQEMDPGPYPNSATVGIESLDGTDGLQVVYNAEYIEDELAVRFWPMWVSNDTPEGSIPAGDGKTLELVFDAAGLEPGTYTADMSVTTNEVGVEDPDLAGGVGDGLQEYVIPITLTVEGIGTEDNDLDFEGTHRLSAIAPNPISGLARASLEVAEAQEVQVELFDVRGRRVATPFEGALAARNMQEITLDGSALAPGVYVLRITGEAFADTRRITVAR